MEERKGGLLTLVIVVASILLILGLLPLLRDLDEPDIIEIEISDIVVTYEIGDFDVSAINSEFSANILDITSTYSVAKLHGNTNFIYGLDYSTDFPTLDIRREINSPRLEYLKYEEVNSALLFKTYLNSVRADILTENAYMIQQINNYIDTMDVLGVFDLTTYTYSHNVPLIEISLAEGRDYIYLNPTVEWNLSDLITKGNPDFYKTYEDVETFINDIDSIRFLIVITEEAITP